MLVFPFLRRRLPFRAPCGLVSPTKRSKSRFRLMNSLRTTKCALNTLGVSCNTHLYNKLLDCRGTTPAINMILSTTPRLASYKASPVAGPLLPIKPPPCFFRGLRSRPRSHPPVKCSSLVHQWLRRLPTTCPHRQSALGVGEMETKGEVGRRTRERAGELSLDWRW